MPTILAEMPLRPQFLEMLRGYEVRTPAPGFNAPDYDLRGVHALIVAGYTHVGADVLARAPDVRVVARPGIGIDTIDVDACTAANVMVVHTPEAPSESTAEHAVALIFAVSRKLKLADLTMRTKGFSERHGLQGIELRGKTLGLVGLGRIGGRVAQMMGHGVGMRVVVFDPYTTPERAASLGVELVPTLAEVLRQADVISLHCPLTPETRGLISAEAMAAMKPGVVLVNCSRGPVINEAVLVEALRSGHIAGAGIDVFDPEPPLPDNPLFDLPNIIVTPHIASFTPDGTNAMFTGIIEEVTAVLRGQRPRWLVNPSVWPGKGPV
jgi:D-3-phosphoglycerate dehydrogenase / 2-oxoglutarate reductase